MYNRRGSAGSEDAVFGGATFNQPRTEGRLLGEEKGLGAREGVLDLRPEYGLVPETAGVSNPDVRADVTPGEYSKLAWINGILECTDSMHVEFADFRGQSIWRDGIDPEYDIDWRSIANRCLPDIVLVLCKSRVQRANRDGVVLREFADFPSYALVPSAKIALDITREGWFEDIRVSPTTERGRQVFDALKVLRSATSTLESGKKASALNGVAMLERLLKEP